MPGDDVGAFFDQQAHSYHRPGPMAPFHRETARVIEAGVSGRVLCIGGLWAQAELTRCEGAEVTLLDLSESMLAHWAAPDVERVVGDAREIPCDDATFDHVVYSLVLHHVTENGFRAARAQLEAVFDELVRILKPGGGVWITDFSVSHPVYGLQALASPITKRALGLAGIPLVVMHPARVYAAHLARRGFTDVAIDFPRPKGISPLDPIQPVIGLPWLRVPRWAYPLRPVLITARRA